MYLYCVVFHDDTLVNIQVHFLSLHHFSRFLYCYKRVGLCVLLNMMIDDDDFGDDLRKKDFS